MSINQLQSRLSSLNMEDSNEPYNLLNLEFPALGLLPLGSRVYLKQPRFAAQRDQPAGPGGNLGTDFYAMIPVGSNPDTVQCQVEDKGLLAAVEGLSQFPGTSILKVCAHVDNTRPGGRILYRFSLESTTRSGFKTSKDFKLESTGMSQLLELASTHRWVHLLDHLINRESDRAYAHVSSLLTQFDPRMIVNRPGTENWGSDKKTNVIEVFKNCFILLQSQNAPGGGEVMELGTSCGHSLTIDRAAFENITVDDCFSATCPRCRKQFINEYTLAEIKASQDSEQLAEFNKKTELWARLDHKTEGGKFTFEADDIFVALAMSLQSFSPPAMACPLGFSFGAYPGTKAVLREFRAHFEDSDEVFEGSGTELMDHLHRTAMNTKIGSSTIPLGQGVHRPRFSQHLRIWLRRAVNLAVASCKQQQKMEHSESIESMLKAMGGLTLGGSVESMESMFAAMGI